MADMLPLSVRVSLVYGTAVSLMHVRFTRGLPSKPEAASLHQKPSTYSRK